MAVVSSSVASAPLQLQRFSAVYPDLEDALRDHVDSHGLLEPFKTRFIQNIKHNALGGSCEFGLSVPDCVSLLQGGVHLSNEQYLRAAALGWMVELLKSVFNVCNDLRDGCDTRTGKPCWFRVDDVGLTAINDASMVKSAIYILLKKYFREHSSYAALVELFHEVAFETQLGHLSDAVAAERADKVDSPMEKQACEPTGVLKSGLYSYYLPVALALYQLDLATERNLTQAKRILVCLGEYSQAEAEASGLGVEQFRRETRNQMQTMIENVDESDGLRKELFWNILSRRAPCYLSLPSPVAGNLVPNISVTFLASIRTITAGVAGFGSHASLALANREEMHTPVSPIHADLLDVDNIDLTAALVDVETIKDISVIIMPLSNAVAVATKFWARRGNDD
ncbi:hypothetical protein NLG97_g36 [Lecanicillium saksenae]|uniref:Uncharacterized protein n=1 Tax=Lecanicillium saksenae TaxID=468837 RepID=A0ACC1R980_9HYPO|nr:hypothetical protein NLG97_g36 [Lecanicillium saksenae]